MLMSDFCFSCKYYRTWEEMGSCKRDKIREDCCSILAEETHDNYALPKHFSNCPLITESKCKLCPRVRSGIINGHKIADCLEDCEIKIEQE